MGKAEAKHSPPSSAEVPHLASWGTTLPSVTKQITRSRHGGKTKDLIVARKRNPSHWVHSMEGSRLFVVR